MSANGAAIERIRDRVRNDAEALAVIFEDSSITDDGTVAGRLRAILEATESVIVPGLQTGITFADSGFRTEFKDPWPSSNNQVGHFLTAVGLSFNPGKVSESFMLRTLRDWLGADSAMTDEEVAIRLCIGHEKAPDPGLDTALGGAAAGAAVGAAGVGLLTRSWQGAVGGAVGGAAVGAPLAVLDAFRTQFAAATAADVAIFRSAETNLGGGSPLDIGSADATLRGIAVTPTNRGNSRQDLLLSLFGWRLGQMFRGRRIRTRAEIAAWVRTNIKAAP
jgi:hypothetical protein